LLGDLSQRRVLVALAGVGLSLGEGPVVVARAVHEQQLPPAGRVTAAHDAAGGAYGLGLAQSHRRSDGRWARRQASGQRARDRSAARRSSAASSPATNVSAGSAARACSRSQRSAVTASWCSPSTSWTRATARANFAARRSTAGATASA